MYPNGVIEETAGQAILPLTFLGLRKFFPIRFAPTFDCKVLFGHDFAELFDCDVRFKPIIWRIGNPIRLTSQGQEVGLEAILPSELSDNRAQNVNVSFSYALEQVCAGLKELKPSEANYLEDFLKRKIPPVPTKLPATHTVEHHIDIQRSPPIRQAYRRLSSKIEESLRESAQKFKAEGIISPSKSEWCNPIVMIRKPDGDYRLCIDFRKLNEVAQKDVYPMRNISTILNKL
ncbi:uncharacterized protein LOC117181313 [Belonocnema kinseyi]|uniref:uncharacterized protein LOC117181313 n=1 Tax=Belonocnema kinseyi TaxID=2817044 RepID=UPI00143D2DA5|nr:uncharacterized protein LOC117181313 [Belonocnema kinseyi]